MDGIRHYIGRVGKRVRRVGRFTTWAAAAAMVAVTHLPSNALAQSFTLNLQDADIETLITTVSEVTGRNFIVDPRVQGKVTVISARAAARQRGLPGLLVGVERAWLCGCSGGQRHQDFTRGAGSNRFERR